MKVSISEPINKIYYTNSFGNARISLLSWNKTIKTINHNYTGHGILDFIENYITALTNADLLERVWFENWEYWKILSKFVKINEKIYLILIDEDKILEEINDDANDNENEFSRLLKEYTDKTNSFLEVIILSIKDNLHISKYLKDIFSQDIYNIIKDKYSVYEFENTATITYFKKILDKLQDILDWWDEAKLFPYSVDGKSVSKKYVNNMYNKIKKLTTLLPQLTQLT